MVLEATHGCLGPSNGRHSEGVSAQDPSFVPHLVWLLRLRRAGFLLSLLCARFLGRGLLCGFCRCFFVSVVEVQAGECLLVVAAALP